LTAVFTGGKQAQVHEEKCAETKGKKLKEGRTLTRKGIIEGRGKGRDDPL